MIYWDNTHVIFFRFELSPMLIFQDVKLKNTNSWASLASLSSTPSSHKMKEKTGASFELFKKQAKEKEERVSTVNLEIFLRVLISGNFA